MAQGTLYGSLSRFGYNNKQSLVSNEKEVDMSDQSKKIRVGVMGVGRGQAFMKG
ncbi:unnamed protein product, partial [marine sediment metagenome]